MKKKYNLKQFEYKSRSFLVLLFFFLSLTTYAQPDLVIDHTFTPAKDIPDPGCFDTLINISGTGLSLNASYGLKEVCFDITHPWDSHISVYLVSPDDVTLELVTGRGGFGDNFTNTCFDGEIISPHISSGTAPFTGSWQPESPMGIINNGSSLDGDWHLVFCDNVNTAEGVINNFSITFGLNAPVVSVPDNDVCINYIEVPVNNDFNCDLTASGTLSQATTSPQSTTCSGHTFDDDVWFSFIAEDAQHNISVINDNPPTNMIFEVFSGNCSSLTSIECSSTNSFQVDGLIPDNRYYIRVASSDIQAYSTLFDICVSEGIPPPPANNEFCGAYILSNGNNYCYQSATFAGALNTSGVSDCQGGIEFPNPNNDIWFQFDATSADQSIEIFNMVGTSKFIYIQVLSGNKSCGGNPNENFQNFDCYIDPNPGTLIKFPLNGLSVGTTYHIRLATFSIPENTVFDICVKDANPPANDECVNAISIPANSCGNTIYTISDATESTSPADQCPDLPTFKDDVWFKFVASDTSHIVDAFNIEGSSSDLIFEVFSGSCGSPIIEKCYDDIPNGTFRLNELNIGASYYVRVASFTPGTQSINFRLCVKEFDACNPVVLSYENEGSYSLRGVIGCTPQGVTITFDPLLEGKTIELEEPGIVVDKDLFLNANFTTPIVISNELISNTETLLEIQSNLTIHNLLFEGKSSTSMKVNIKNGAKLISN